MNIVYILAPAMMCAAGFRLEEGRGSQVVLDCSAVNLTLGACGQECQSNQSTDSPLSFL